MYVSSGFWFLCLTGHVLYIFMDHVTFTALYIQVLCVWLAPVFTTVLASVTEESFFKYHTSLHDAVKGKLAASQLASISQSLLHNFKQHLNDITTGGEVFNTCFVIQTILHYSSDLKFTSVRLTNIILFYIEMLFSGRIFT